VCSFNMFFFLYFCGFGGGGVFWMFRGCGGGCLFLWGGGGGGGRFRNPKADHRSKNQPVYPVTIQHWRIGTA